MLTIIAPHPAYQTTLILPSPGWSNFKAGSSVITKYRAMDGTLYTYVKPKSGQIRHQWSFVLSQHKMLELQRFMSVYHSELVKVVTHEDDILVGYIMNNPTELTTISKAVDWPGGEAGQVTLDFEEVV